MEKRQFALLGAGIALAVAAIGLGAARRAQRADEEARAEREAAAQAEEPKPLAPLPSPPSGAPIRTEKIGGYQIRVRANGSAGVFTSSGDLLCEIAAYQSGRVVPHLQIFGGPIVELAGKGCDDPCNPHVVLAATRGGAGVKLLEALGVPKLDDLDRDGVPEALVDHLMNGTREVVTLPYRLEGQRYVAAYARFPDGVDRQIASLSPAVERLCADSAGEECLDSLAALLGLSLFRSPDGAMASIDPLHLGDAAKAWAHDKERMRTLAAEIAGVLVP